MNELKNPLSRRKFVKKSTAAAFGTAAVMNASSYSRILGANDRINIGFLGCGATDGDLVQFESQDPLVAGGIGGRSLFADDLGLWVGVDVARGPEEYVGYIQVGHAW